jgi:uncharacterized protein
LAIGNSNLYKQVCSIVVMDSIFYNFNPWWEQEYSLNYIIRDKYFKQLIDFIPKKEVVFLTGLRRVGKTTLMYQLIEYLLKSVKKEQIFYISLDLLSLKDKSIYEIIQDYRKIHGLSKDVFSYVFLDEITIKKDFHQELKNLYDLGNIKIFVSSSSATKLKDTSAFLTGRARYIEVEPLDFNEFLLFNNYSPKKKDYQLLEKYFEEYMEFGGMPEYVLTKDPTYITEVVNNIILKDIVAKYGIKNTEKVFDLFRLLMERVGKPLTYSKIANILDISKDSVQTYINYFLETYLFSKIEVNGKLNERIKGPKKFYCGDVGIKNVSTGFRDKGAIYENLVYNKIKSDYKNHLKGEINFLYKDGVEIDFVTKDFLLEAKFGQEMNEKQKNLFDNYKIKNKIVARGVDFFIG